MQNAIIYLDPGSAMNLQNQIRQKLVDGILIATGHRGQNAPAVFEQFGKTGFRPAMFRARNRVSGNEMNTFRDMGTDLLDHRFLG